MHSDAPHECNNLSRAFLITECIVWRRTKCPSATNIGVAIAGKEAECSIQNPRCLTVLSPPSLGCAKVPIWRDMILGIARMVEHRLLQYLEVETKAKLT